MSAGHPSVPSAARSPNVSMGACPTALFMFDRGLCTSHAPAERTRARSRPDRWTPCASTARSFSRPWRCEPIDDARPVRAPGPRVVVFRFGHVDVDAGPMVAREIAERGQARVAAA